jgi:UDP-GlcNAc:undecaprenyl-phosphate GlcNAc-1-phosphate transferase
MVLNYLAIFSGTIVLSVIFTLAIKYVAKRLNIVDEPGLDRKIHKNNIPLLGGMAIFLSFFLMLFLFRDRILAGNLETHHLIGFFVGACFLMLGGFLDDKYNLKPGKQLIFPLLAIASVVAGGIGIEKITNPLGGLFFLDQVKFPFFYWGGETHYFVLLADGFTIIWLMGMMYTTKLLDGIDGLVSGVAAIGGLVIFLFTITTKYYQPDIGLAALIFSASCLGFLVFNWHPAKIFLGEGGSLLLGFILGVLAIISGGKIAIALLVMGIPILDLAWTIIRRMLSGKNPFKFSDRLHLHFRLFDSGLGQRKTALVFYFLALVFGASGLFLQSLGKALALMILFSIMTILVIGFSYFDKKKI